MLYLSKNAKCLKCKENIKIVQPDGTEMTERFVCDSYKSEVPVEITAEGKDCRYFRPY